MAYTGTYDVSSLLKSQEPVLNLDFDQVAAAFAEHLRNYNAEMIDALSIVAEPTIERSAVYGAPQTGEMQEQDEYGRGTTTVDVRYGRVAYPLRRFTSPVGWTSTWFAEATASDMAGKMLGVQVEYAKRIRREIQRALYPNTNFTFNDHLTDNYPLDVTAMINADGSVMPNGPYGEEFDGATHDHYNAAAALTDTDVQASMTDLLEHGHGDDVRIIIHRTNQTEWEGLASFTKYDSPLIMAADNRDRAIKQAEIYTLNRENRAIGIYQDAEVWIKPWAIPNYAFFFASGDPEKPLAFRQPKQVSRQGLRMIPLTYDHPLYVDTAEALFGFGVRNRTNGVVLYHAGGAYVAPTIPRF